MSQSLLEKYKNLRVKLTDHYAVQLSETINDANLLLQVQRSPEATMDDFLFEVGHYLRILRPEPSKGRTLLHLACGNGLYNPILAAFYDVIVNVDPVEEMMAHCMHICRHLENQVFICDYGDRINQHYPRESFNDVFFLGVANLVRDPGNYFDILDAVSEVITRPGRLLIGRISDESKRAGYLSMLPGHLARKGFPVTRIDEIVQRSAAENWYSMAEIARFLTARGARSCVPHDVSVQHVGHQSMTDMLVTF